MNICQLRLREHFRLLTLLLHLRADIGERRSAPFLLVKTPQLPEESILHLLQISFDTNFFDSNVDTTFF